MCMNCALNQAYLEGMIDSYEVLVNSLENIPNKRKHLTTTLNKLENRIDQLSKINGCNTVIFYPLRIKNYIYS